MALTFALQVAAATDPVFTTAIQGAITLAAEQIYSEGAAVAGHAYRAALATKVVLRPGDFVIPFANACAVTGVDKLSTDAQISNAVASVWNLIAGVN